MFLMDSLIRRCSRGVPQDLDQVARSEGMDPARLAKGIADRTDCDPLKPKSGAPEVCYWGRLPGKN